MSDMTATHHHVDPIYDNYDSGLRCINIDHPCQRDDCDPSTQRALQAGRRSLRRHRGAAVIERPTATRRRTNFPCILEETGNDDRRTHAWESRGLDIVGAVLSITRRCVWCGRCEHKPYGAGSRRGWKVTTKIIADFAYALQTPDGTQR